MLPPKPPNQSAPAPEAAGLARAPHPSASGWSFRGPAAAAAAAGKSSRETRRHDDTSGLLGTFGSGFPVLLIAPPPPRPNPAAPNGVPIT